MDPGFDQVLTATFTPTDLTNINVATVTVSSETGRGSTFTVTLPAAEPDVKATDE